MKRNVKMICDSEVTHCDFTGHKFYVLFSYIFYSFKENIYVIKIWTLITASFSSLNILECLEIS